MSDELVTTEVLGLPTALNRSPVLLALELHRLNGERLEVELAFPDEVAALVLKAFATRVRNKATDVVDVWRCLEVAFAAGAGPHDFTDGDRAETAARGHHERHPRLEVEHPPTDVVPSQLVLDDQFTDRIGNPRGQPDA